ncbi:MAG: hypothetical protein HYY17_06630 [Planctomycetes bacterium]|nr:hypothetical protein [Planctomycetota bacterium]
MTNPILRALGYALSLPERTVRGLAASVGGASKLLTDTLLPKSLRGTAVYRHVLGNTQRFVIQTLGGVKSAGAEKLPDGHVPRAIVGSVVDNAGLLAFHFSPLWFFAIVSDVAGGARSVFDRVVAELKREGAIAPDAAFASAQELLDALAHAGAKSAIPFDAPPLSVKELKAAAAEIAAGYRRLYAGGAKALPTAESLWAGIEEVRKREPVELLRLAGAMTLASAKAAGKASGGLLYETIVRSYADSIASVRMRGFADFLAAETKPYVDAVADAFAPAKRTWTEKLLSGALFRKDPPAPPESV